MITSSASQTRVWFITGCSSGLGRALAQTVLERGEIVVLTALEPQLLEDLAAKYQNHTLALRLDVTKPEEIKEAVTKAIAEFGRIDVLVNNAGWEVDGAIEEVSNEAFRRVFDTNLFGVLEILRAVVPHMRQRRSGHILNISSIACFEANGGMGFYTSSKLALEGISVCLAQEVAPFGIKVTIVEPGSFRTDFMKNCFVLVDSQIEDYKPYVDLRRQQVNSYLKTKKQASGDPKKAAIAMIKAVESENPPIRLALGSEAVQTIEESLESIKAELDTWREVSMSTDFDEVIADKAQVL
ncbi:MAG: oxidoreductase [Cyanobacteria bacterium P01_A01_bin.40]